ncbi:PadR family transcriptional regulator [Anaerolineae bacterium AMX1]|nr:PadR family transcriptional regulator [Anaerolineae bacterium AMX1]
MDKPHYIGTLSPEMALLGLLYRAPAHGYDLHRKVAADLGQVWHLSQSQAYAILKRLEKRGDISGEEIPQEKLPPRLLLKMTGQGRARFLGWLETPSGGSTRAIRMEEARKHIQRLQATLSALPDDQIHNRMSLELRLGQLETTLSWLDDWDRKIGTSK